MTTPIQGIETIIYPHEEVVRKDHHDKMIDDAYENGIETVTERQPNQVSSSLIPFPQELIDEEERFFNTSDCFDCIKPILKGKDHG